MYEVLHGEFFILEQRRKDLSVIIFGCGGYYKSRKELFMDEDVIAMSDNNTKLHGTEMDGRKIIRPIDIQHYSFDYVCVMTGYKMFVEIKEQLINLNIPDNKIVDYRVYFRNQNDKRIDIYSNGDVCNKQLNFFLTSMANTGGFRAAVYAMKSMLEKGITFNVISPCTGEGTRELQQLGIDLIISPDISEKNAELMKIVDSAETIILNAQNYSYFLDYLQGKNHRIIWWLHMGESGYDIMPYPYGLKINEHTKVFGVSNLVCDAFKKHSNNQPISLLPYGIPDEQIIKEPHGTKTVFAVIGRVTHIKGFDIVIKAVKLLSEEKREKIEVWFIGEQANKSYFQEVEKDSNDIKEIKWFGKLSHDEVIENYKYVDVLISASREDMLPIVIVEAMMNKTPCIISDAVGTVDYVTNNKNAIVFESENVEQLAEKMAWCIENKRRLDEIGAAGRLLFEEKFSMEAFGNKLEEIIRSK